MSKLIFLSAIAAALISSAGAETRVWADKKGNTIQAEFMRVMGPKVVLKKADGKTIQVPIAGLSAADQKFLATAIPPRLKIDVDLTKKRVKVSEQGARASSVPMAGLYGSETKADLIDCSVTIAKTNREASDRKFKAYAYLFSQNLQNLNLKVLDISEAEVSFTTSRQRVEFSSNSVQIQFVDTMSYGKTGEQYGGYLVVVEDENGKIVLAKGSKSGFESNAAMIRAMKKNDSMTSKFKKL